jgi:hypothetical protein
MADKFWVGGTGSWDATTTHWSLTSGGAAGAAVPTAADNVYFDANSGGGTVTVNTATRVCLSLSFRGTSGTSDFTGTFAQSGTGSITISGGLTLSASTTYTYAGAITFAAANVNFNITSNGAIWVGSNITINATGVLFTFTDAFVTTGILTITSGALYTSVSVSIGTLSITSNSLLRGITTPNLYFTGSGTLATIGATQTNLIFNVDNVYITNSSATSKTLTDVGNFYPNVGVYLGGSGSGAITFANPASTGATPSVFITNTGGATISINTGTYNSIIFQSGTNAVWNNTTAQTLTVAGNITLASSQGTILLTPAIILNGANAINQIITSNGRSFVTGTMTINDSGTNVAYTFADAFSSNAAFTITNTGTGAVNINANFTLTLVTNTLTITAGNLNVNNGANVTCGLVSCLNTGVRTINMGSGTWNLTGVGIVWNFASATNTTINAQQSRILINDTSNNAITFASGNNSSFTYYTVEFARGASTGTISITSGAGTSPVITSTFANFINNTSTAAHTMSFTSGATLAFYKFNVKGFSTSARISLNRSGSAATNFIKLGQGIVSNADNSIFCNSDILSPICSSTTSIISHSLLNISSSIIESSSSSSILPIGFITFHLLSVFQLLML